VQPVLNDIDTRLMRSKKVDDFLGAHVLSIAGGLGVRTNITHQSSVRPAIAMLQNVSYSSISLSWPASRLDCFRPIRIGRTISDGTLALFVHFWPQ
jgi:hypothetical protein